MTTLPIAPLTKSAFAPYGDVVEMAGASYVVANQGFAERCDALPGSIARNCSPSTPCVVT